MILRALRMRNFMRHTDTRLVFPARGVVLVHGENGAGKSSICEAVATVLWGKTLRGTVPWTPVDGAVDLEFTEDGIEYTTTRTRKGVKSALSFSSSVYSTAKKAQADLSAVVGDFDVWKRSDVFQSVDALLFTRLDDGDRKRLLETILGLDRFEAALKTCRDELRVAEAAHGKARMDASSAANRHEGETRRLEDAQRVLARDPPPPAPAPLSAVRTEAQKLGRLVAASGAELARLRIVHRAALERGADGAAEGALLRRALLALRGAVCPTCTRPITPELRADLDAKARGAEVKARAVADAAAVDGAAFEAEAADIAEELEILRGQLATAETTLRAHAEATVAHEREAARWLQAEQHAAVLVQRLAELDAARVAAGVAEAAALTAVAELEACERVLSTRGVRALLLTKALVGLEAATNAWLERIDNRLAIVLKDVDSPTSGSRISLGVVGAGAGLGYAAASNGERRRVDLALVFALAEVSAAAHGRTPGTVFVDEALDGVDDEGAERVAWALDEIAQDRCVVVISHKPAIQRSLRPSAVWHVRGGVVTVGG